MASSLIDPYSTHTIKQIHMVACGEETAGPTYDKIRLVQKNTRTKMRPSERNVKSRRVQKTAITETQTSDKMMEPWDGTKSTNACAGYIYGGRQSKKLRRPAGFSRTWDCTITPLGRKLRHSESYWQIVTFKARLMCQRHSTPSGRRATKTRRLVGELTSSIENRNCYSNPDET